MTILFETQHFVADGAGWDLALRRVAKRGTPRGRPVLIVPGYGMNSFIFGFHPTGLSMEEHLADAGLEVFSVDLRGQGRSVPHEGARPDWGLGELAVDDLGVVIRRVLEVTTTRAQEVDLVGVSLGASLSFAHLACVQDAPVRCLVSMGGLVTWVKIHPLLRLAFGSPALAGAVRMKNTRALARRLLPIAAERAPSLLSVYLHAESTDLTRAHEMAETVEDPNPRVNRQIAMWMRRRELVVRGVNVSRAVPKMKNPFLCFVARNDGIVPPATARWPYDRIGSSDRVLVEVGTSDIPIAHADLFISRIAPDEVFTPLAKFLLQRQT
jgi:pimeloyl-ACP methyl ester carboxylesterase